VRGLGEREGSDEEVEEEEVRVGDLGEEKVRMVEVVGGEEGDEWGHEERIVVAPCDHRLGLDLESLVKGFA